MHKRLLFVGIMLCGEGQDLFITLKIGGGSRFNKCFFRQFMSNRDFGHLGSLYYHQLKIMSYNVVKKMTFSPNPDAKV
jgi:hypothetical protein